MKRRELREILLQVIFQMDFHRENFNKKSIEYLEEQYLSERDMEFSKRYIENLNLNRDRIDKEIIRHLKGWTLDRLSKVDLAILRLAAYEILFEEEIPQNVSINEAVELSKKYSEDDSRKFINGILDALSHRSQ